VVDGLQVEGTFRSHQVPLAGLAENPEHVTMLAYPPAHLQPNEPPEHPRARIHRGRPTTTPFDMTVRNRIDRFHLVMDVAERVPAVGPHGPHVHQTMRDRLVEHHEYFTQHGKDLPEIREWTWSYGRAIND